MREATLASAPPPAPLLIARTLVVAVVLYFIAQKLNDRRRRARAVATPSRAPVDRATTYSREDVAKHAARDDLWVIIDGKVYDLTEYVDEHPGGAAAARRRARGAATTRGLARSRVGVRILSVRSVFVSITDDFKDRARVVVAASSSSRSPRSGRLV